MGYCLIHVFFFPSGHEAARLKINEEFKKNKNETSEENIKEVSHLKASVTVLPLMYYYCFC